MKKLIFALILMWIGVAEARIEIGQLPEFNPNMVPILNAGDTQVVIRAYEIKAMDLGPDEYDLIEINITDEIAAGFTQPSSASVIYVNQSGANEINITNNVTITITNTEVRVNSSNISQAIDASLRNSDELLLSYTMTSSKMAAGDTINVVSNASATSTNDGLGNTSITTALTASASFLRAWKVITSTPSQPLNITVRIFLQAVGGNVSGIMVADYLPDGAAISSHNVTYYNTTNGETYSERASELGEHSPRAASFAHGGGQIMHSE